MNKKALFVVASVILSVSLTANSVSASSYTVQSGDTLWRIAHKHSISITDLKQWNSLTSNLIVPNQQLKVAAASTAPAPAPAAPSPAPVPVTSAPVSTYTVKSGDTLYRIALESGSSLAKLRQWNNLQTDLIFVGQQLKVSSSSAPTPAPVAPTPAPAVSPAPAPVTSLTYRVVAGDTLNKISGQYNVSVDSLKAWNGLTTDLIYIGQSLKIGGTSAPAPASPTNVAGKTSQNPIAIATSLLGTPYAWGGKSPAGFDCSGFIYYVYKQAGSSMGRTNTTGYFNYAIPAINVQPGDLVFFKDTYRSGISHMGIYLGNREFIHAGSSGGVQISSLDDSYWKSKFDSFKRFN